MFLSPLSGGSKGNPRCPLSTTGESSKSNKKSSVIQDRVCASRDRRGGKTGSILGQPEQIQLQTSHGGNAGDRQACEDEGQEGYGKAQHGHSQAKHC